MSSEIAVISTASISGQLKNIADTGLLERGCINVIQLDAIQRQMADKWPRRREQVWEHVEKTLQSDIDVAKIYLRLNETSYLICLSGYSSDTAKMQCALILRETLNFFLGSSSHEDIVVRNVTSLADGVATTTPVTFEAGTLTPAPSIAPAQSQPIQANAPRGACMMTTCGGPLLLEFSVERVFNVLILAPAARRIKAHITDAITGLPISDARLLNLETAALISIDQRTAEYALELLSEPEHLNAGVLAPISIQTAANPRGRNEIQQIILQNAEQSKRRLIIELVNVTRGTPTFHLAEATAFFRVRGIFGRVGVDSEAFHFLRNAQLHGIVIETGSEAEFSRALVTKILGFGDIARSIAPALIVGPLPKEEFVDICRVAGATHVTFAEQQNTEKKTHSHAYAAAKIQPYQQFIYMSRAVLEPSCDLERSLKALKRVSNVANKLALVTGMLLHYDGWFLQVLEGTRAAIGDTMTRIFKDTRHADIQIISAANVAEREFPRWNMTALSLPGRHLAAVDALGLNRRLGLNGVSFEQALSLLRAVAKMKDEEEAAALAAAGNIASFDHVVPQKRALS